MDNLTRMYGIPAKDESSLPGEALLVAAFLRLMVADARRAIPKQAKNGIRVSDPEAAQAFLRNTAAVRPWAELMNCEVDVVQKRLLQAAGLFEEE